MGWQHEDEIRSRTDRVITPFLFVVLAKRHFGIKALSFLYTGVLAFVCCRRLDKVISLMCQFDTAALNL